MATGPGERVATRSDRARLTIDLDAVVANWRALGRHAASAEIAGVVKADAYGLGATKMAPALARAGCRSFFVALIDEALALRPLLPDRRIAVLAGVVEDTADIFVAHDLVPVLNSPGQIAIWQKAARAAGRALPAFLHLDTGMCRLGLGTGELDAIDADALSGITLAGVISHLACADEPDHPLNRTQLRRFEELRRRLPPAPASLANSSGIFLGPDWHLDLCRPGIALYGANPTPGKPNPMAPVIRIEAPVLQVHEIDGHGSVGYGASWPVRPGARIATLPLGYADGMLRAAGGRAQVRFGDSVLPVAGRISMDLITIDATALPAGAIRPGDMVEVLGGRNGLDEWAAAAGTIAYEVLTRLGGRFERHHLGDDAS